MSRVLGFIKTTAMGGLLIMVPVAIVLFVLTQVFYGLYGVARSIVELPAIEALGLGLSEAALLAAITIAALIALCFVLGLVFSTRVGRAVKRWMSANIARRIPMYGALSNLTKRVAGVDGNQFTPVEVDLYGSESRALGFLVEELPDGRCAVFVPTAPVGTVGNIHILPAAALTILGASVTDTASVITQWGVDAHLLYGEREATRPAAGA